LSQLGSHKGSDEVYAAVKVPSSGIADNYYLGTEVRTVGSDAGEHSPLLQLVLQARIPKLIRGAMAQLKQLGPQKLMELLKKELEEIKPSAKASGSKLVSPLTAVQIDGKTTLELQHFVEDLWREFSLCRQVASLLTS
jgi:hypothetical protein